MWQMAGQALESAMNIGLQVWQEKQRQKALKEQQKKEDQLLAYEGLNSAWKDYADQERAQIGNMLQGFSQVLL